MAGIIKVDRVQSDSNLAFQIGSSNVAFMDLTGLQMTGSQLSLGGTTIIPAVGQIAFPATQNVSTDANTLDDYEEGTWTPVLTPATGTITSQSGSGTYVKIGRVVTCTWQVQITGGTISAIANLTGLPFVYNSTQNYVTSCAREWYASGNIWQVVGSVGSNLAQLIRYDNSSTASNNFGWAGTITYITNS